MKFFSTEDENHCRVEGWPFHFNEILSYGNSKVVETCKIYLEEVIGVKNKKRKKKIVHFELIFLNARKLAKNQGRN